MKTIKHMSLSVRGALTNKRNLKSLVGNITVKGVKLKTAQAVRDFLLDELAKGHELLPMSEECEGFDYVKGCPGHPVKEWER